MLILFPVIIVVVILVFICIQNQSDNRTYNRGAYGGNIRFGERGMDSLVGGGEHRFTVKEPWFSKIESGDKSVEGRLKKGRFEDINKGDEITWVNRDTNAEVKTVVTDHKTYDNIPDMVKGVGVKKLLPGFKTDEEGVDQYNKYYSPEKQSEHKAIAIHFTKI
jgi:ASC-1-like (ASCH) protein